VSVVTIDVVPINGEPMWRAIVNGKEYLERSGRRLRELVSRLTAASEDAATVEAAQD
jgi:hypothetical protein